MTAIGVIFDHDVKEEWLTNKAEDFVLHKELCHKVQAQNFNSLLYTGGQLPHSTITTCSITAVGFVSRTAEVVLITVPAYNGGLGWIGLGG